ncbi:hypothetical protein GCM10010112_88270 [Actinoplanes lobatus]|nr:hypothetical protein GCM10010112_88270 [Actinoplanes lobatus]
MILKRVLATGAVSGIGDSGDGCGGGYRLTTGDRSARLHFKGMAAVSASWGTETVEGIGFNSSYAEVLEAYPDFAMAFGGNAEFTYGAWEQGRHLPHPGAEGPGGPHRPGDERRSLLLGGGAVGVPRKGPS